MALDSTAFALKKGKLWGARLFKEPKKWAVEPVFEPLTDWSRQLERDYRLPEKPFCGKRDGKKWAFVIEKNLIRTREIRPDEIEPEKAEALRPVGPPAPKNEPPKPEWSKNWRSVDWFFDEKMTLDGSFERTRRTDFFLISNEKWRFGVADSTGRIVVEPLFFSIQKVRGDLLAAHSADRPEAGERDRFQFLRLSDGKLASADRFYWSFNPNGGLRDDDPIVVWSAPNPGGGGELFGLVGSDGRELIAPEFEAIGAVHPPGFLQAKRGGKIGLIGYRKELILPFEFDNLIPSTLSLPAKYLASKNGKWGFFEVLP